ncbi:hypothetical protein V1477_009352 [Vespula maculifrons]|uniref:Uncharacterized protein n=1 Tax=Vespula maculifrons TaxID=7453 RepID=A0ABD2CBR6_VESMC
MLPDFYYHNRHHNLRNHSHLIITTLLRNIQNHISHIEHKSLFLYLQTFFQSTKVTIIESQRRMTSWKQQDLPIFTFNQYCSA